MAYVKTTYGAFDIEKLQRVHKPAISNWNSFSVPALSREEAEQLRIGIHGDGLQRVMNIDER